ncbi:MAG: hypothetical protein ACRDST_08670 [Pseudonocardiaceae bacterium]
MILELVGDFFGAGVEAALARAGRSGYWLGAECDEIIMDALAGKFPGPSAVPGSPRTR